MDDEPMDVDQPSTSDGRRGGQEQGCGQSSQASQGPQRSSSLWHSMKRLFRRGSDKSDASDSTRGAKGKKKKWQSAGQLPGNTGQTPKKGFLRRRLHGKFSQSHDTLACRPAAPPSTLSDSTVSLQEPRSLSSTLGRHEPPVHSSEDNSSDLGLPSSPRTLLPDLSESWQRRYKRRASGAGVGSSTGSEQSLISLNSSNDSARVSVMSSSDSLARENEGLGREPMRLRHDAALHKRAIRPRARMGPSKAHRRLLAEQWTSGRFNLLPTTPEVNEDSLLSSQENLPPRIPPALPEQPSPVPGRLMSQFIMMTPEVNEDSLLSSQENLPPRIPPALPEQPSPVPENLPPRIPPALPEQPSPVPGMMMTPEVNEDSLLSSQENLPPRIPPALPEQPSPVPEKIRRTSEDDGSTSPKVQSPSSYAAPTPMDSSLQHSTILSVNTDEEMQDVTSEKTSEGRASAQMISSGLSDMDHSGLDDPVLEPTGAPGLVCSRSDFEFVQPGRCGQREGPVSPGRLTVFAPTPLSQLTSELHRGETRRSFGTKRPPRSHGSSGSINRVDRVRLPSSADSTSSELEDEKSSTLPSSVMLLARHHATLPRSTPPLSPAPTQDSNGNLAHMDQPRSVEPPAKEEEAPSPVPTVKTMEFDSRGFLVLVDKPAPEAPAPKLNEKENYDVVAQGRDRLSSSQDDDSSSSDQQEGLGFSNIFAKWKQVDHAPQPSPHRSVPRMGVSSTTYYSSGRAPRAPYLQRSHTASEGSPPSSSRNQDTLNGSVDSGVMVLSEDDYHPNPSSVSTGNLSLGGSGGASPLVTARSSNLYSASARPPNPADPSGHPGSRSRSSPPVPAELMPKKPAWTQRATETRRKHRERTQEALQQQSSRYESQSDEIGLQDMSGAGDAPRRQSKVLDLINTFQNLQSTL